MQITKSNILLLLFSLAMIPVMAQKNRTRSSGGLHFIDGIELNRNDNYNSSSLVKDDIHNSSITANHTSVETDHSEPTENISSLQIKYAQMLNVEIEKTANKQLFEFIENWMDTRYRFGGSSKSGIDCSGFSGMLCKEVYKKHLPRMASEQYKVCEKINKDDLSEGDLVFFNTRGGVSHVGVYLANDYFVHSSTKEGVIISSLNEEYYHNRFIGGGRVTTPEQVILVKED